jgi:prepilin-type N-terminal cleavage/methylation domain-containing protein
MTTTRRSAFTLVEVVIAAAILGILLAGMASAVMLASRAVPDGKRGASATLVAGRAVDLLAGDLFYATSVSTATATELVISVPDRNNDGMPETVRYRWSGTQGDPLTRQFNGGTAATAAENVQEFGLTYQKRQAQVPTAYGEGPEVLLASYDTANQLGHATIDNNNLRAEYFAPTLPAEATSWRVSRIQFRGQTSGFLDGTLKVQLRPTIGGLPGAGVLEEVSIPESALPTSCQWKDVGFSNVSGLAPGTGVWLALRGATSNNACEACVETEATSPPNLSYRLSSDGGTTWSTLSGHQLRFYAYGKVTTPNPATYQYLLLQVSCTLRTGSDASCRLQTSIRVVNEPQVSGP